MYIENLGIADYDFRVLAGITKIEFDENKEGKNRKKHGYSLKSAVWLLSRLCLPLPNQHYVSKPFKENEEIRHQHLLIDDHKKICVMVTTMRDNETVRIISFRSAGKIEKEQFKKLQNQEL